MGFVGGCVNISDDYDRQSLVPWLQKLVDPLLNDKKYHGNKVKIIELDSSAPLYLLLTQGYNKCDRFTLCIPYGQITLKCKFVTNRVLVNDGRGHKIQLRFLGPISFVWSHPEFAPIIGFDDDDFRPSYEILTKWDFNNQNALIDLIDNFVDQYRKFQISICRDCDRLQMELDNLKEVDKSKMDVFVEDTDAVFIFFITIAGVSDLPKVYTSDTTVDDQVILKVRYRNFAAAETATAELVVCPFLNTLFGSKNGPRLPPLECFLSEYVDRVQEIFDDAVREIKDLYELRMNFIVNCRKIFKITLDGDFVYWTRISFLMEHNCFYYVLHVKLPNTWPTVGVDVQAASVYHERHQDESPFIAKYTWKPTLSDLPEDQLAEEFKKFAEELGPKFKNDSMNFGV